jgi:NitT/TauT family transport system substrate-binding protein
MSYLRRHASATSAAAIIATALTLSLATACSSSTNSGNATASTLKLEKTNLVVGAVPAESVTPVYIAEQRGIFKAHGLHVTIESIVSTDDVVPDLLHGSMDIAGGQLTSFIAAQAKGLGQFRVLASGLALAPNVNEIMTLPSSGITSAADLKGKTIAVNAATGDGVLLTDAILAKNNIKPSEVTLKTIPFPAMSAALAAHQVDAAYVTAPYGTEMQQSIGATEVANLDQGPGQGLVIGGFTVTTSWAKKYPHTAAAFAESIDEAAQVADTNHAADVKAFETYLHASSKVAAAMPAGTFPTTVSNAKLEQVASLMTEFGELAAGFNATALNALHG